MKELLDKIQLIREKLSEVRWADDLPEDVSVELEDRRNIFVRSRRYAHFQNGGSMTTPDQINAMAEHAASAAVDCFGKLDPPGAPTAYSSFIYHMAYDENGPLPAQLTSREFRRFRHDYCRWLRNAGVDLDTAQTAAFGRS